MLYYKHRYNLNKSPTGLFTVWIYKMFLKNGEKGVKCTVIDQNIIFSLEKHFIKKCQIS